MSKNLNKILVTLIILVMIFALVGCSEDAAEEQNVEGETKVTETGVTTELTKDITSEIPDPEKLGEYFDELWSHNSVNHSTSVASFELFKKLAGPDIKDGKNTMISPISFMVAMGMLENGAAGDSLREIEDAFGIKIDDFNSWYDVWYKVIKVTSEDSFNLANSIWYKDAGGLYVEPDFLTKMGELYRAQAYSAPFDEKTVEDVNNWVKENTNGMIDKVLDNLDKDTVMMLLNAAVFEGKWAKEYKDDQIKNNQTFTMEDGTEQTVTMLESREERAEYYSNDLFKGTRKNYSNGFSIALLLPNDGLTVSEVIDEMSGKDFTGLLSDSVSANVALTMPEFKFDYEAPNAIRSFKDMGVNTVFDEEKADLSPMAHMETGENLSVSQIIHKTHIELDRKGTKAAAVTEIGIIKATSAFGEVPEVELTLDRPFIFAIMENDTDTPIFIGTVNNI